MLDQSLFCDHGGSQYDLAIADASSLETSSELKQMLAEAAKPAILIHARPSHSERNAPFSQTDGCVIEFYCGEPGDTSPSGRQEWAEIAALLGREILRRSLAEARQRSAEKVCANVNAEATLGRYMVEMRHNVNNALTTVLGNAELLTLEPGLPSSVLAQADTIRNMALRLHEIFQRFSSIEKELSVAARESGKAQTKACAAGSR